MVWRPHVHADTGAAAHGGVDLWLVGELDRDGRHVARRCKKRQARAQRRKCPR